MAGDVVATETISHPQCSLEIDRGSGRTFTENRASQGLLDHIETEIAIAAQESQADPIYADALPGFQVRPGF
jgi:hypothetical protein